MVISALMFGLIGWTGLAFLGGVAFLDFLRPSLQRHTGVANTNDAVAALVGAPLRWASASMADHDIPRLRLEIKDNPLSILDQWRDDTKGRVLARAAGSEFVSAEIQMDEKTVGIRLRLEGEASDSRSDEKWSMGVHVKETQDPLFDLRRFSLHSPETDAFQTEPIVLDHHRREGVLTPRHFLVDLSLNGDDIGLMALEESLSIELLESQQRSPGIIIRFREDPLVEFSVAPVSAFASSPLELETSTGVGDPLEMATRMLRSFVEGTRAASEVFDIEQMSRFIAVSEVWTSKAALHWQNLRFYFNPNTLLLEPIAFDIDMQSPYVGTGMVSLSQPFFARLLDDPRMRTAFVSNLQRIAGEMTNGVTTARVRELEESIRSVLNREFPMRRAINMDPLERRAATLVTVSPENIELFQPSLVAPHAVYPDAVLAHLERDALGDYIEFVNVLPVPVIVDSLAHPALKRAERRPLTLSPPDTLPLTLPPTELRGRPTPIRLRYKALADARRIEGRYFVQGQRQQHEFEALPYAAPLDRHPITTSTLEQILEAHRFLAWDESTGRLRAAAGERIVEGSMVLPAGVGLLLDPGTTLRFRQGEALIASGPLVFLGNVDEPVILEGIDSDSLWSGIVSFRSDEAHQWKNVIVRNTSGIDRPGWLLTGGVTLRDADVQIEDSLFESNRCEDALNLVRSEFELINTRFVDVPSDAFDGDFSNGRVVGGSFSNVGGDGIDVSGANVRIENVTLTQIHDKALSIGEGSHARISGVRVDGAGTALASKDTSHTEIADSLFERIDFTAIMAYVKKPEYGPSEIIASNIILREVGREALAQLGSRVTLNGVEIEPEAIDIDSLYKQGHMRK
ncbi:MAG: CotH kinase family protein [Proteobacteria bacterium]|nr:CotH kinase family protein [Pseudomonadota bacterium]